MSKVLGTLTNLLAGLPRENPIVFYSRRVWEVLETHVKLAAFYLYLHRIRRRVERDPHPYTDAALAPLDGDPSAAHRKEKVLTRAAALQVTTVSRVPCLHLPGNL